jgi:hypothetical protein
MESSPKNLKAVVLKSKIVYSIVDAPNLFRISEPQSDRQGKYLWFDRQECVRPFTRRFALGVKSAGPCRKYNSHTIVAASKIQAVYQNCTQ